MNPEEQKGVLVKLKHEQANSYYTAATGLKCERHMRALRLPYFLTLETVPSQATHRAESYQSETFGNPALSSSEPSIFLETQPD